MKNVDTSATSNAEKGELVASTEEGAHVIQMHSHSKNTSAMPTDYLTILPSDLQGEIASFLSDKELMRLMMTSKEFFNNSNLIKTMIRKIKQPYAIKQLVAGGWHTLALTQEGRVLTWGFNDVGQLGLGHHNNQNTPRRVNMMPSSIQALLQYLEDHYRKISAQTGGKAVYLGNDNGDAKERSSSCSTAAASATMFSSGHQSRASVTSGLRSIEGSSLN